MGSNLSANELLMSSVTRLKIDQRFMRLQSRAYQLGYELDVNTDGVVSIGHVKIYSLAYGSSIECVLADIVTELAKIRGDGYMQLQ